MAVTENIEAIMSRLEKVLNSKTVIGEAVEMGDVTLIPVVDVTFGFGAGGGEGKTGENTGTGGGGGGGGRVAAKAVIVIQNGEVNVLPLVRGGSLERVLEMIPGLVDKVQARRGKSAAAAGAATGEGTADE